MSFDGEPGEGSGVLRSLFTAAAEVSEGILYNDSLCIDGDDICWFEFSVINFFPGYCFRRAPPNL